MYNPINMNIEDQKRLQEKDLREKNKKKRYEVRYVADEGTRNQAMALQERQADMSLRKVSVKRM